MANEVVFRRYSGNPIVTPKDVPGANSTFNSAVLRYGKAYVGVFRIDMQDEPHELHTGWSDDGVRWRIDPKRIKITGKVPKGRPAGLGYDPRVTKIGGTYYVTWCYYPEGSGPSIGLGANEPPCELFAHDQSSLCIKRGTVGTTGICPQDGFGSFRQADPVVCSTVYVGHVKEPVGVP